MASKATAPTQEPEQGVHSHPIDIDDNDDPNLEQYRNEPGTEKRPRDDEDEPHADSRRVARRRGHSTVSDATTMGRTTFV